jgi:hypothetical protein
MRPWIFVAFSALSSSCICGILNIPNRSRFILWRYAFRYFWYIQLHACIPTGHNI